MKPGEKIKIVKMLKQLLFLVEMAQINVRNAYPVGLANSPNVESANGALMLAQQQVSIYLKKYAH